MSTSSLPYDFDKRKEQQAMPRTAQLVINWLGHIQCGQLHMTLPDGKTLCLGTEKHALQAQITIEDWQVFQRSLKSGDIGFAECYIEGLWTTTDLVSLLRLLACNRRVIEKALYGSWWGGLLYRVKHLLQRNSKAGSRKNIYAHYDLGNDFYALWLDTSMNYSSALDLEQSQDMECAQKNKMQRCLQEVQLQAEQRVLEIGCGWGAVAELVATDYGAHYTGVTLSPAQLAYARARLETQADKNTVDLRLQDYRDIAAQDGAAAYDAIVSIEMLEAVGRKWWPDYFAALANLLKPGGKACVQTIVIDDALFARYIKGTDFIQQYIFPGGCLPSSAEFMRQAQQAGLRVGNMLAFGTDYAKTLAWWRERFTQRWSAIAALGFDTQFYRTWEFYLAYCEAGFAQGNINVLQFTLHKD